MARMANVSTEAFIEFLKAHPISSNTINDILYINDFPSFGPYDGRIVSAFWNLNIYINQRHLSLSFALVLLIIYILYLKDTCRNFFKKTIFISCIMGLLILLNKAAFVVALIFIGWLIILPKVKLQNRLLPISILITCLIFFLIDASISKSLSNIYFMPGFLLSKPLEIFTFLNYWFHNIGLYLFLIPLSFVVLREKVALQLIVPTLSLFLIANTLRLSVDIINNHKFFNFFLILGGIYTANLLVYCWQESKRLKLIAYSICIILFFLLIFSGFIDFMVIKNDTKISLDDIPKNQDASFISQHTKPRDIILNSTFLYHPATLAGRSIFYGYPYFIWSYGYDYIKREQIVLSIYRSKSKSEACEKLLTNKISYVELNDHPEGFIKPDFDFWNNAFISTYYNPKTGVRLFDVKSSCASLLNH